MPQTAAIPTTSAGRHDATRRAHATELAEDYVELIDDLINSSGEARVVDLARSLGVTHVTVIRTIRRLARDGLVTAKPYRSIHLTDEGRALATKSRRRHAIVVNFLLALGVDAKTAEFDAEGIEHHVSAKTLRVFAQYVRRNRAPAN
jgi:DtxR family transcriptional regulator, manganese transport regulator